MKSLSISRHESWGVLDPALVVHCSHGTKIFSSRPCLAEDASSHASGRSLSSRLQSVSDRLSSVQIMDLAVSFCKGMLFTISHGRSCHFTVLTFAPPLQAVVRLVTQVPKYGGFPSLFALLPLRPVSPARFAPVRCSRARHAAN